MNQPIEAPTSFVSFKKLSGAPTIPRKMVFPTTTVSNVPASAYTSAPAPAPASNPLVDYVPLVAGFCVIFMMVKF